MLLLPAEAQLRLKLYVPSIAWKKRLEPKLLTHPRHFSCVPLNRGTTMTARTPAQSHQRDKVADLAGDFETKSKAPHLRNIFRKSHTQRSCISTYEYNAEWQALSADRILLNCRPSNLEECWQVIDNITGPSSGTSTRLVVIEDICSNLVRMLAEQPLFEAEFFEQHLINAGWFVGTQSLSNYLRKS
jgi:hypothetical protein